MDKFIIKIFKIIKILFPATILLLILFLNPNSALAFDTGYHFDLTRDVLLREGFKGDSIDVVQVMNYYADGFGSANQVINNGWVKFFNIDDNWAKIYGPAECRTLSEKYLHFGHYNNRQELEKAWERLIKGTYNAVREAQKKDDPLGLLAVLGMSLHQVQDFYAHSDWSVQYKDRDATWFDFLRDDKEVKTAGITEKDHAGIILFPNAYREAFYATWQWVRLVEKWVSSVFWEKAKNIVAPGIEKEKKYVTYISWYSSYWKGRSSESKDDLFLVATDYIHGANHTYLDKWAQYCPIVTANPDPKLNVPMTISPVEEQRWLEIRTQTVYQYDDDWWLGGDIDSPGQADFYAVIEVNGVEYREAMHEDQDIIHPINWLTQSPISPTVSYITVKYDIWDEDVAGGGVVPSLRGGDDHCDIVPGYGSKTWVISGTPDSFPKQRTRIETETNWSDHDGDGDEAAVHFDIALFEHKRQISEPDAVVLAPVADGPFDLKGEALSESEIKLTWTDRAQNEIGYEIERKEKSGNYAKVAALGPGSTEYCDLGLSPSTMYTYRIRALYAFTAPNIKNDPPTKKYGVYSNEIQVTTKIRMAVLPPRPGSIDDFLAKQLEKASLNLPNAPSELKATVVSDTQIDLTWADNSNNEENFVIERGEDGIEEPTYLEVPANITSYQDKGLKPSKIYYYRIKAFSSLGCSAYSNNVWEKTADPPPATEPGSEPSDPGESSPSPSPGSAVQPSQDNGKTVIKFYIDEPLYYVNDAILSMDTVPVIKGGRTFIPIRYLTEAIGASIEWDGNESKVTIGNGDNLIELWIGRNTALVNGIEVPIDPADPQIFPFIAPPGRTMIPLRFVAENLGCVVEWDPVPREVKITYPGSS